MKPIKVMQKLNESALDKDAKTVYLLSADGKLVYKSETEPIVLQGLNSYVVWNLYLVAGKEGNEWVSPEHFTEDEQYASFAQYIVQESLQGAAEANDFRVVTSDDNLEDIEIVQSGV